MGDADDILQLMQLQDITKLIEIYKNIYPRANYIYNYLNSVIRWKRQRPDKNDISLFAPINGQWLNGTFIGVHQFWCYELVMFTLEDDCKTLCQALSTTKQVDWSKPIILYATHSNIVSNVLKCLEKVGFSYSFTNTTKACTLSKENALKLEIECPEEVFISKLEPKHANIINPHWPPRYPNSEKYLAAMIDTNGGYGVFLKSNGQLVSWVIRNLLGLGALQTLDGYKKKGYGSLVTKVLSKEIASDGFDPIGTVNSDNENSLSMFRNIGFEMHESVVYIPSIYYETSMNCNEFPHL